MRSRRDSLATTHVGCPGLSPWYIRVWPLLVLCAPCLEMFPECVALCSLGGAAQASSSSSLHYTLVGHRRLSRHSHHSTQRSPRRPASFPKLIYKPLVVLFFSNRLPLASHLRQHQLLVSNSLFGPILDTAPRARIRALSKLCYLTLPSTITIHHT